MSQGAGRPSEGTRRSAGEILDYTRDMAEAAGRSEWETVLTSQREQDLKIRRFFAEHPGWGLDPATVEVIRQIGALTDQVAEAGQEQRAKYAGELRSLGQGMRGRREYLDTSRLA